MTPTLWASSMNFRKFTSEFSAVRPCCQQQAFDLFLPAPLQWHLAAHKPSHAAHSSASGDPPACSGTGREGGCTQSHNEHLRHLLPSSTTGVLQCNSDTNSLELVTPQALRLSLTKLPALQMQVPWAACTSGQPPITWRSHYLPLCSIMFKKVHLLVYL